jgi:glycosyltransferase involved in cell wall biosynthesis
MFVTAAAGARDNYQVPLALYESGLLASHVTDFYTPDELIKSGGFRLIKNPKLQGKLLNRNNPFLPSRFIHNSAAVAFGKLGLRFLGKSSLLRSFNEQDAISMASLKQARQKEAGLLAYAGYAYKAFISEKREERIRGLVQYHPHITLSAKILKEDLERYPILTDALASILADEKDPTNQPELEIADFIICCSSFTLKSCLYVGIPSCKISVIPYGIDLAIGDRSDTHEKPKKEKEKSEQNFQKITSEKAEFSGTQKRVCRFIFVGSGIHRKGLHHLLIAWQKASLKYSILVIVNRYIDPQIRQNFDPGANVEWKTNVSKEELRYLYESSAVFVMPSLVEGFGYVYLEAMSRGCYCIGTTNTGLVDILNSERHGICTTPGDVRELVDALKNAEEKFFSGSLDRFSIKRNAIQRSWASFRSEICKVVSQY